jgi:hypothetical protein
LGALLIYEQALARAAVSAAGVSAILPAIPQDLMVNCRFAPPDLGVGFARTTMLPLAAVARGLLSLTMRRKAISLRAGVDNFLPSVACITLSGFFLVWLRRAWVDVPTVGAPPRNPTLFFSWRMTSAGAM